MKAVGTVKKPFGTAKFSPVKNARYLDWEDAFDVEFDDGLSFLEPHKTIRRANKISPGTVSVRVSVPKKFRTHFKVEYDNGEIAEVSWSFIRELPPKNSKKSREDICANRDRRTLARGGQASPGSAACGVAAWNFFLGSN